MKINKRSQEKIIAVATMLSILFCSFFSAFTIAQAAEAVVGQEVISHRTKNTKLFDLGNGGYIATLYDSDVHYEDPAGGWKEIDNRLTASKLPKNSLKTAALERAFCSSPDKQEAAPSWKETVSKALGIPAKVAYRTNTANSFSVSLPETIGPGSPVVIDYEDYQIQFALLDVCASEAEKKPLRTTSGEMANSDADVAEFVRKEASVVSNQQAATVFRNVLPHTDLIYTLSGKKLKEDMVFSQLPEQTDFSFVMTSSGLTPVLQDNGEVWLFDDESIAKAEPKLVIQAPYMYDALDEMCMDIEVSLQPVEGGYIYTLTPDREWLMDPARVYPVTLDPTYGTSRKASDIQDNGVNAYNPTTNYIISDRIYVGSNYDGRGYESRMYIRFPRISSISTTAYIQDATMQLNYYPTSSWQTASNLELKVHDVEGQAWNTNTITWNSQAKYTFGNPLDTFYADKSHSVDEADITSVVRKWYSTTAGNNGVMIKARNVDESKTNRACYISSDYATENLRPYLIIEFYEGNPLSAINDSTNYYVRNVCSGLLMKSSATAQTQLVQAEYSIDGSTEWRISYVGGGLYTFTPKNKTNCLLTVAGGQDVEGQRIEVNTAERNRGQMFRIISNGDLSYRLLPICSGSRVVSLQQPNMYPNVNICLKTWKQNSVTKEDSWLLITRLPRGTASSLGGDFFEGTYDDMHLATAAFNQLGYESDFAIRPSREAIIDYLEGSSVVYLSCHGDWTGISWEHGIHITGVPGFTFGNNLNLSEMDIDDMRLMILACCSTNANPEEEVSEDDPDFVYYCNFAQAVHVVAGVDYVIAWDNVIPEDVTPWLNQFFDRLYKGESLQAAVNAANAYYADASRFPTWDENDPTSPCDSNLQYAAILGEGANQVFLKH